MGLTDNRVAVAIKEEQHERREQQFHEVSANVAEQRGQLARPPLQPATDFAPKSGGIGAVPVKSLLQPLAQPWNAANRIGQAVRPLREKPGENPVGVDELVLDKNELPQDGQYYCTGYKQRHERRGGCIELAERRACATVHRPACISHDRRPCNGS